MTIDTLFGAEEITSKPRTIKFKQIKAVYEPITVREDITNYLKTAYDRVSFLPERRNMMQTWADYLDGLKKGAKVIPIKKAA